MPQKKGSGVCGVGPSKANETLQTSHNAFAPKSQPKLELDDDALTIYDGRIVLGFLRRRGLEFEIFRAVGDSFVYAATGSRAEALALLRGGGVDA